MRTTTFLSVYNDILTRHGLDPLGDAVTHDTARAITTHMNDRIVTVWQMWDWPELTITEERAYRSPWNSLIQYRRVGANGMPDEVYNIDDGNYYRVNASAPSDPPFGVKPTVELAYWTVFTPTTFVDRDQPGMRPMGQVFGVYQSDPSLSQNGNNCCSSEICLGFRPSELGVTICNGPATTVFIQYLMPVPQYTFVPFISGKTYVIGDRAFNTADGNVYRCITNTNNQAPPNPQYWVVEPVPAKFAHYLDEGTYADTLIETFASGEDQIRLARAQAADQRATESVQGMIDDLLEQGQKHHWLRRRWWGFSWHYDGTIQWPTSGNWCQTEPWSGNVVYPLTGLAVAPELPAPPLVLAADTGITPLVSGQSYVDVVFDVAKPNTNWVFTELRILNTLDPSPLNIWPGIVSSKTAAGFRLQLNGLPDTGNYVLQWTINTITTAPQPATTYGLSGPATGAPGIPSTFTVQLPSNTTVTGILVVTPSDGGAGGTFSPASVGLTTAGPTATFTYRAASSGTKTISVTNNGGLIDPASVTFAAAYATTYSISGPAGGNAGVASANFTVALLAGNSVPAPVTVTPSAGGGGGTFTPASVSITTGAPSATFTYTPASGGVKTISVTNSGGLTNPGNLTYTSVEFDPSTIAGLKLWLKADAIAGVDGDLLSAWNDSSVNGYNMTNTGGAARPTFKTGIVNGKPVVRFDGVANKLANSVNPVVAQPNTVFAVGKQSASGTNARWVESYTITHEIVFLDTSGYFSLYGGAAVIQDAVNRAGAFHVFTAIANGASSQSYVDGSLKASGNAGADGLTGVALMWDTGGAEIDPGDYAELLIYNSALGSTDRTNVEHYLKTKWATP